MSTTQPWSGRALHFVNEAFSHYKAIAATDEGLDLLLAADILGKGNHNDSDLFKEPGVVGSRKAADLVKVAQEFVTAIAEHRQFDRKHVARVPA